MSLSAYNLSQRRLRRAASERRGLKVMGKVRAQGFAVSIDGFGAGLDRSLEHPMGKGGRELHKWFFPTRTFRSMIGLGRLCKLRSGRRNMRFHPLRRSTGLAEPPPNAL